MGQVILLNVHWNLWKVGGGGQGRDRDGGVITSFPVTVANVLWVRMFGFYVFKAMPSVTCQSLKHPTSLSKVVTRTKPDLSPPGVAGPGTASILLRRRGLISLLISGVGNYLA